MTELLERAIARLKTLPASDQDAIAAMILEELEDEVRWDATFAKSQNVLAFLAAEAKESDNISGKALISESNLYI